VRPQHTGAINAHIDTIREALGSRNNERIERVDPVADIGVDGESVIVAVSTAIGTRADGQYTIRSLAAVKLVVVGALGLAGIFDCCTLSALDVNTLGGRLRFEADGPILGPGGRGDFGESRAAFLEGRRQDEAGEDGEWEDEGGETHGVVI